MTPLLKKRQNSMSKFPLNSTLNWRDLILFAPIAYAMTAMWWIPEGDKYVPAIILAILLYFLASRSWKAITNKALQTLKQPLAATVVVAALICAADYKLKGGNISELRTLSALGIFSGLSICMTLTPRRWLTAILISGAGFIIICFYQFFIADMARVHLNYNPIPFATGLATVLISTLFLAVTSRSLKIKCVAWISTLLLFIALAMTGTRGVALPVTLILFAVTTYLLCKHAKSKKFAVAGILATIIISIAIGGHIFEGRINATMAEMALIKSGDETGSIGLRLQFWKAAVVMATLEPLTGLGEDHKSAFQTLAHQGLVNQAAEDYAPYHYHNQFLDILVKQGVPGLLALLALLAAPVLIALKHFRSNKLVLGSVCGIAFMYTVASLTDVPFNHPTTINLYILSMIALLSLKPESPEFLDRSGNNPSVTIQPAPNSTGFSFKPHKPLD